MPLAGRLGGPQNRSGCCGGQNLFVEIRSPHRLSCSLFATLRTADQGMLWVWCGAVRLLTIVDTILLLLVGAIDFHILHSVHYKSITII